MAHLSAETARSGAQDCIRAYDEFVGDNPDGVHHPTTNFFLQHGGPLRHHVTSFAAGEEMHPDLKIAVARLARMPVVERCIESPHSLITRRAQKRFRSGRVVSSILCVPEIQADIRRDAAFLQHNTTTFAQTRNATQAEK